MSDETPEPCSITFGPRGCSDARLAISRSWRPGGLSIEWVSEPAVATPELVGVVIDRINQAELFWVSAEMCELIESARPSIPLDSSLLRELVPHDSGLIFFSTSLQSSDQSIPAPIAAMAWDVVPDFISISTYAHFRREGFMSMANDHWRFGDRLDSEEGHNSEGESESGRDQRTLLMTFLALLASPGIATTTVQVVDRSASKRSMRAGVDVNAVRVIYLRSPQRAPGMADADSDRYHHRWIVSGHWRSQPYGPGRAFRKPVWIGPHVKGPHGAPLLDGDKVRAVVR